MLLLHQTTTTYNKQHIGTVNDNVKTHAQSKNFCYTFHHWWDEIKLFSITASVQYVNHLFWRSVTEAIQHQPTFFSLRCSGNLLETDAIQSMSGRFVLQAHVNTSPSYSWMSKYTIHCAGTSLCYTNILFHIHLYTSEVEKQTRQLQNPDQIKHCSLNLGVLGGEWCHHLKTPLGLWLIPIPPAGLKQSLLDSCINIRACDLFSVSLCISSYWI